MKLSLEPYIVLFFALSIRSSSYTALAGGVGGFSVELIHRDSPKSPLYNPDETPYERLQNAVNRSIARANHIASRFTFTQQTDDPKLNAEDYGWDYIMTLSLGTPPFQVSGIMDTGSNLLWTQCAPCSSCYQQSSPMFHPSKSSTYKDVPCRARECSLAPGGKCDGDTCSYEIKYGGGQSSSSGKMGFDTFTVGSLSGGRLAFTGGLIGCGYNNHGPNLKGPITGIFGLGPGPVSIVRQMGDHAGGKFSHCLIPFQKISYRLSIIHFGNSATVSGPETVSTPLWYNQLYWVTLNAVTIGSTTIQNSNNGPHNDIPGNIIVDSGTAVTFLDRLMYSEIANAVKSHVKSAPVEDAARLCYQGEFVAPPITIHFKGADVSLGKENTFMKVGEDVMCLAFRAKPKDTGLAIYGSFMQMDFWVEYDLQNMVMSFKKVDCTEEV